jgi:hypothetical protein
MAKTTDEIMGWQGHVQSAIEPYCDGYLWAFDGEPDPAPVIRHRPLCEQQSLQQGIEDGRQALRHSSNRYSPNPVK